MLESTGQRLERLIASAADLIRNAPLRDDYSGRLAHAAMPEGARDAPPPTCTEPYCGGFRWTWDMAPLPKPLRYPPSPDASLIGRLHGPRRGGPNELAQLLKRGAAEGKLDALTAKQPLGPKGDDYTDDYPEGSPRLLQRLEQIEQARQQHTRVGGGKMFGAVAAAHLGSKAGIGKPFKIFQADFFPPLRAPVAREVELRPPNLDNYPTYLAPWNRTVKAPTTKVGGKIFDHLDDFLRVRSEIRPKKKGGKVYPGQKLLAVKMQPRAKGEAAELRLGGFIGKKELKRLPHDRYPLRLIFGGMPESKRVERLNFIEDAGGPSTSLSKRIIREQKDDPNWMPRMFSKNGPANGPAYRYESPTRTILLDMNATDAPLAADSVLGSASARAQAAISSSFLFDDTAPDVIPPEPPPVVGVVRHYPVVTVKRLDIVLRQAEPEEPRVAQHGFAKQAQTDPNFMEKLFVRPKPDRNAPPSWLNKLWKKQ